MEKREFKKIPSGNCPFCKEGKEPDYKDIPTLERFTTDRGKIISRSRTGVCQKHQRWLNKAIKRARFLAFLPFITRI